MTSEECKDIWHKCIMLIEPKAPLPYMGEAFETVFEKGPLTGRFRRNAFNHHVLEIDLIGKSLIWNFTGGPFWLVPPTISELAKLRLYL